MASTPRFGSMLQEHLVARVREIQSARREARARVRTRAQLMALRDDVRAALRRCFGPNPPRTPLNARVTGVVERLDYRIEKLLFESRPGFLVSANLYVPSRARAPMPAVLAACGHSDDGKAIPTYQTFVRNLARQGYLTLIYDPIGQGERWQFPRKGAPPNPRGCVQEHNMLGNSMALVGEFFGQWRVWDGVRALDYLLSRPEADPSRVGMTGNSGGGTLSTYLTAFDERFTMAAPSCFVTRSLSNVENELPADSEQLPPGFLAEGLDAADYFIAQLPRPTLLLGQNNDFFDRRGLTEIHDELKRLYGILGAGDDIQLFIGPVDHGFSVHNREAMYRFFNSHARVTPRRVRESADDRNETERDLRATPKGQVNAMGSTPVFDFTRALADGMAARRRPLSDAALRRAIAKRLQLPERNAPPYYRVLRPDLPWLSKFRQHSRIAVETEPGILALLHVFTKTGCLFHFTPPARVVLHVPDTSSIDEAPRWKPVPDLFYSLDPRGIGETRPLSCNNSDFFAPYDADYFYASHGLMLRESLLGRRVHDLLSALDLFQASGCRHVHLVGHGLGAITATFAACLHPLVQRVTLHNALLSYHELTQVPVQSWPLSALVPGILKDFDLPDCHRMLRGKALVVKTPWNARRKPALI